jgi:hypothetical protein
MIYVEKKTRQEKTKKREKEEAEEEKKKEEEERYEMHIKRKMMTLMRPSSLSNVIAYQLTHGNCQGENAQENEQGHNTYALVRSSIFV